MRGKYDFIHGRKFSNFIPLEDWVWREGILGMKLCEHLFDVSARAKSDEDRALAVDALNGEEEA